VPKEKEKARRIERESHKKLVRVPITFEIYLLTSKVFWCF